MPTTLRTSAVRLVIGASLTLGVGLPILACSGGGADVTEKPSKRAGDDSKFKPAKAAVGMWKVKPGEEDLRKLKVIDMALNRPQSDESMLSKKLKPSPTPAETEVFKAIKALAPDSPEAAFFKTQLDMMKTATLQITKDTYILDFGPEHEEYEYTVAKEGANRLTVKLDSGEVHELTFDGPDRIEVLIRDSGPEELNLTFVRKN